ncbi:MAG: ABC transporter ATP-binding protein [Oscillospiraceae bacterium]|nr:ABC transporter ATP-binding protein [Oscillospiraceae bacterium]
MLRIENYSKSYVKDKKAVDGLSLEVEAGDLFAFIGHNGAGKTTTIKSVVGILPFEEGRIEVDGIDITADPVECKKRIAYIPDNPDMYDTLTGIQYLNFIADIYRISKADREERVRRYAEEFEIAGALNDPINSYSHGMKQKLEIIGALLHEPKLIVMDEPFVGLDPKAAFTVKNIMRDFCARGGAIFFSTHVLEVAEKLCNKIAIIKGGKLVACGTMEEVKGQSSLEDVFMELIDHE